MGGQSDMFTFAYFCWTWCAPRPPAVCIREGNDGVRDSAQRTGAGSARARIPALFCLYRR